MNPSLDGLTWEFSDFKEDGTHLQHETGGLKVAELLMDFFGEQPWFLE